MGRGDSVLDRNKADGSLVNVTVGLQLLPKGLAQRIKMFQRPIRHRLDPNGEACQSNRRQRLLVNSGSDFTEQFGAMCTTVQQSRSNRFTSPTGRLIQILPQPPLPQVPTHRSQTLVGSTPSRLHAGGLLPCGRHTAGPALRHRVLQQG